ncbi:MAG: tandem-95 repeat protein, partial [Acidobacteria bacterium]|nr:tandem-95 repeat protein [Acidobacteriota bacterium]
MNVRRILLATLLFTLLFSGIASASERAIVPVAGSTAGVNGANFRTEMQLHNPGTGVMRGAISFLPQGDVLPATLPPAIDYEVGPKKTLRYDDVIASLGASGLGSLDVVSTEGPLPRIVVRAFDDQGNFGTRGLVVPAVKESDVPVIGFRFVLVAPADIERYRFNIGVRTLSGGEAKLRVTERDAAGASVGESFDLTYLPETFRQKPAADLLGRTVVAGHSYSFELLTGAAIVYATTVDNQSNDGSLQLDRPVNRAPVISDQSVSTGVGEAITVSVTATDPDGDPITFRVVTAPSHGTLSEISVSESLSPLKSASVVYTPAAGYEGPDSFTLGADDDVNGRGRGVMHVIVGIGGEGAPDAESDLYGVVEGETLVVAAPGVLANDSDPDGDPLTAVLTVAPNFATAFTFNPDGSFTYTAPADFAGNDTFLYQASDGTNASPPTTVKIKINIINEPPIATNDVATTDEDTPIGIAVLANDSDPEGATLTVVAVNTAGTLGSVTIGVGGVVNYDPTTSAAIQALAAGGSLTDTFSYTISDGAGGLASATVTVTVNGIDDLPVAVNDSATMLEDASATAIDVLANDTDPDGGTKLVTGTTNGTSGTVATTGGGTGLTYTPNPDFCGADSFTYTITGGSTATVNVTVTCVNDVPSFTAGAGPAVLEDSGAYSGSIASGVSAGPANEAGQTLAFNVTANTNPALFSAGPVVDAAGNLTFTPDTNANGTADITITLADDGGTANGGADTSAGQSFTITVTAVNDAPSFTKGADETVLEGSGLHTVNGWATALSAGPADESGQTLTFNVSNDNNALFTVQPAIDASGNLT